ncbi:MAG: LysM peptidoglycan-binding domain-containing protein [Deltaproteobacteria bacterium]|nr:LysM peptidoglycan-binding domain-containing protein [Deltaproteobacteria bacterium]
MALLFLTLAQSAWSQQYFLYSPKPVSPEEAKPAKDNVLVREVPVRKGDTLFGISRTYSGRGSYYPQILLFNDIKNPDLIHAGDSIRVPLPKERAMERPAEAVRKPRDVKAAPAVKQPVAPKPAAQSPAELPISELKRADGHKAGKKQEAPKKTAEKGQKGAVRVKQAAAPVPSDDSRALFEKAVKAYRQEDCRTALDLLDRFLAVNPASPQAADASLYKADCYLKLSGQ